MKLGRRNPQKKLKPFFDEKKEAIKRIKAALSFSEVGNEDEVEKFFKTNAKAVFTIIQASYENILQTKQSKQTKIKQIEKDLGCLMDAMQKLLALVPSFAHENTDIITEFLSSLLYVRNKRTIRERGLTLFLLFLDTLGTPDKSLFQTLLAAMNLGAFRQGYRGTVGPGDWTKSLSAPSFDKVILIKNSSNNTEEAVAMFEIFIEFISTRPDRFDFWFRVLKEYFLVYIYTEVSKAVDDKWGDEGFLARPPTPLQAVIVKKLEIWMAVKPLAKTLLSDDENLAFVLDFYSQAMRGTDFGAATVVFNVYHKLFWPSGSVNPLLSDDIAKYRKFFIHGMASPFQVESSATADQTTFCMSVLQRFKKFAANEKESLINDLLYTLLDIARDMYKTKTLVEMGRSVIETVLYSWIRSGTQDEKMWNALHTEIPQLFEYKEVVDQVRSSLEELTTCLTSLCYPKPREVKKKKNRMSVSSAPDMPAKDKLKRSTLYSDKWDETQLTYFWHNTLGIFKSVNTIPDPKTHATAIKVLADIAGILLEVERKANYKELLKCKNRIPILDIFGKWFFEACELEIVFAEGTSIALATLCKIICGSNSRQFPSTILLHFYRICQNFLTAKAAAQSLATLLEHSQNIFGLGLEGVTCLIPAYLKVASRMLKQPKKKISLQTKKNALAIVCSLICYPGHYPNLEFVLKGKKCKAIGKISNMTAAKTEIMAILLAVIHNVGYPVNLKITAVCGITVMVVQELTLDTPNPNFIRELIEAILLNITVDADKDLMYMALECLNCITVQLYPKLTTYVPDLPNRVVLHLATVTLQLMSLTMKAEALIVRMFDSLQKWCISTGSSLLQNPELADTIFKTVEYGILGTFMTPPSEGDTISAENFVNTYLHMLQFPQHGFLSISNAAEAFLFRLLDFYENFPPKSGPALMNSAVKEDADNEVYDEDRQLRYYFNDHVAMSLVQVQKDSSARARIIVRAPAGNYCWDATLNDVAQKNKQASVSEYLELAGARAPQEEANGEQQGERQPEPDKFISTLAESIGVDATDIAEPKTPSKQFASELKKIGKALHSQAEVELSVVTSSSPKFVTAEQGEGTAPSSRNHFCRLLLSHLNLLSVTDSKKTASSLVAVENSSKLQRIINQVDKSPGREVLKIGLIYVLEGQEDEREVLKNDGASRSQAFSEFVNGLGWAVNLGEHYGYTGGLDEVNLTTGATSPYYADANLEVIFHDITSMITDPKDPVQLLKKRHVGNDIVQIIYSEHSRDYSPLTITSQFNDSHVVTYPLNNGLFRIQIHKKPQIKLFGPLVSGMVLPMSILSMLVRETAVNANKSVRFAQPAYQSPYPSRRRYLQDVQKKISDTSPANKISSLLIDAS